VKLPPIRILLVDDHDIVREAISMLIASAQGLQLVGSAATGEEAVLAAQRLRPDVIVMDLGLPGLSGMDATRNIIADLPNTRVIAFSGHRTREYVQQAFAAGARGYVLKESAGMDLLSAVSAVAAGHRYTSPAVTSLVA
jgi:DNA-binding NarL/FixJ family response regulator